VEKNKSEMARRSGKTASETPAPHQAEIENAKKQLCQARNFFIFFALLGHPLPAVAFR